jgi:NAD(P)H-dependent FMN reductase
MIQLLAISGSLRRGSANAALLDAAGRLLPGGVSLSTFASLAAIPAFNPDEDVEPAPEPVASWRAALAAADGVIISSPEYAHGVPGALKNALDWVVGSGELMAKPIALLNASSQSLFAHRQLAETLTVMSANVVPAASMTIDIPRRGADGPAVAGDPAMAAVIRAAVTALVAAIPQPPRPSDP